ncbi:MAG: hypothetical protein H6741_35455 [Alphaproteobacteria bacterium]|nr:hypothetical protein [Alphaproteobacteria bacterium]MCB9798005.1 hypothetical protein [Alphaproteobacteria bacterium]
MRLLSSIGVALLLSAPALAQDDDEKDESTKIDEDTFDLDDFDSFENDNLDDDDVKRLDSDDEEIDLDAEENIDDEGYVPTEDEGGGLFGDELEELGEDEIGGEGEDNAEIYRDYRNNMNDLGSEEELLAWERYLEKYPNSLFRERIDVRMEELTNEIYGERLGEPIGGYQDAKDREIGLSHPILLENMDPRTRLRAGFEIGLGSYYTGVLDFEYQLLREWSVHAGARRRYTGGNIEVGTRYALVKSARLNLLVSGALDLHFNTNPGYPAVRPMIAAGKRFDLGNGLDVQAQLGADLELPSSGRLPGVRYVGGLNATYLASDVVSFFFEGSVNMKHIGWDDGSPFMFNVMSFGLRFTPGAAPAQISLNANVPVAYNYWGYHFGAVQGDVLYYMDDLPHIR